MPMAVAKRDDKFRVVDISTGKLAKNASGTPVDGGGFPSRAQAQAQIRAINFSKHRKQK